MKSIDVSQLSYPSMKEVAGNMSQLSQNGEKPKTAMKGGIWVIREGITPVELYCYLNARFGPPNGMQMLFRSDDSDNLIHWHYTFNYKGETIEIMCMTFRLEIMHSIEFDSPTYAKVEFIKDLKKDFSTYGKSISKFRNKIEKWQLFINPFFRIKSVIEHQLEKLEALKIEELEPLSYPSSAEDLEKLKDRMGHAGELYTEATALGLNIRMLAPVYAESFINLIIFLLAEDDIKTDKRMYDSIVRQQIDIRIKGLHRNCKGFFQAVDYNNTEACKAFHTLMNNRNDLLHGNVDPKKLAYETVYFDGKIPLFNDYRNFSFYSWEASIRNVTPELAIGDYQVVQNLIAYILICLEDNIRAEVCRFLETKDPGWNESTKRPGVLFPSHLVDMFPKFEDEEFNKRVN
jgi:hypothetical protein